MIYAQTRAQHYAEHVSSSVPCVLQTLQISERRIFASALEMIGWRCLFSFATPRVDQAIRPFQKRIWARTIRLEVIYNDPVQQASIANDACSIVTAMGVWLLDPFQVCVNRGVESENE